MRLVRRCSDWKKSTVCQYGDVVPPLRLSKKRAAAKLIGNNLRNVGVTDGPLGIGSLFDYRAPPGQTSKQLLSKI